MAIPLRSPVLSLSLAALVFLGSASSSRFPKPASARQNSTASELTVHEWGTFTSIADRSGFAVRWHPRSGPRDLPNFVEYFANAGFKSRLAGTVRMETPVLYFYSPSETTVSVSVRFSKGVITEWYPHASHTNPDAKEVLDESALFQGGTDGSIAWDSVTVEPGLNADLPRDNSGAHYYAARETSAAPVVVRTPSGTQQEKFLFYRGVAAFSVPVIAQALADGQVIVRNPGEDEIAAAILFERRGDLLGYRLVKNVRVCQNMERKMSMNSIPRN